MATKEEKEAAKLLAEQQELEELQKGENLSDEELAAIEAEGVRIEQERAAKKAAKLAAEGTKEAAKTYSEDQVKDMMRTLIAEMQAKQKADDADGIDAEDLFKQKKIRLPRLQNKFILGFVNQNDDEYFPELVIHAFDVWSDQEKRNVAWAEVLFEDNTTLKIPLYTLLTKSTKIQCDLIETIKEDKSYSQGKTEVRGEIDADSYSAKGTGMYVKMKVSLSEDKFKVRLPDGKEVVVGGEVVNW